MWGRRVIRTRQRQSISFRLLSGAGLVGIDKSDQDGTNWVSKARDFFNVRNGQLVYLNNYSSHSGGDWWYDLMPNVYFHQLRWLFTDAAPDFAPQLSR